jgi:hypothetical protein
LVEVPLKNRLLNELCIGDAFLVLASEMMSGMFVFHLLSGLLFWWAWSSQ